MFIYILLKDELGAENLILVDFFWKNCIDFKNFVVF